jgi:hypothetical protein
VAAANASRDEAEPVVVGVHDLVRPVVAAPVAGTALSVDLDPHPSLPPGRFRQHGRLTMRRTGRLPVAAGHCRVAFPSRVS